MSKFTEFFTGKKNSTALSKQSSKVLNVFTKTQQDLDNLNRQALSVQEQRKAEAEKLKSEIESLDTLVAANAKYSDKIKTFLND